MVGKTIVAAALSLSVSRPLKFYAIRATQACEADRHKRVQCYMLGVRGR